MSKLIDRASESGEMLLEEALGLFLYFQHKEEARICISQDEFHMKSVLDDILHRCFLGNQNTPQDKLEDSFADW